MPLGEGEKYGGTIKARGKFKRAVVGPRGKIRRWETFDGEGNEVAPKPSIETVSKPEGEEPMASVKPKADPEPKGAEGAEGKAERNWWPWIAGAGFLIVGAAVGAALWTRRTGALPGAGVFGRLRDVSLKTA
jgi:hypothetical protein